MLKFDAVSWSPSFARPDFTIDRKRVRPAGCRGADVSIRNNDNATAAMVAADHGDEELADLLSQRQALKRLQMRGSQVVDMNVVANAGAVRRRIFVAEDRDRFALA